MKQIPLEILKNKATLFPYTGQDDYGNAQHGTEVELENIYIEPVSSTVMQALGEYERYELTLYYDAVNSKPSVRFTNLDKIIYNGKEYGVRMVADYFNPYDSRLHHSEVRLYGN